jgi:hypothetical protein
VGALAFTVWDILITLDDEVRVVTVTDTGNNTNQGLPPSKG